MEIVCDKYACFICAVPIVFMMLVDFVLSPSSLFSPIFRV